MKNRISTYAFVLIGLAGCSSEDLSPSVAPPVVDLCEAVVCDSPGTVCSPADGLCHCPAGANCEAPTHLPPAICNSGTRWAPGTAVFRDVTDDWGLRSLGVQGVRLSAADIDGDGYVDVFIRKVGNGSDDFAAGGARQSWLLRNTGDRGFEDVTATSGVRQTRNDHQDTGRPGEVVVFADVDNDSDVDVYTGMSTGISGALPGETSELMLNDGTGHFVPGPSDSALRRVGDVDAVAAAAFTDFDRDGNLDLWVAEHNYTPAGTQSTVFLGDHLYRGDGAGDLSEVTVAAGVQTEDWGSISNLNEAKAHSRAWSATVCDLNDDAVPELLVASYGRSPNHLWQGQRADDGTVTFSNRSVASGYAYDEDQDWTDNEFAKCYCEANPQAVGCSEVATPRIRCGQLNWRHEYDRESFRLGGNSGATVCADVNNDGHLDLLTTEITHWWAGGNADRSEILLNSGEQEVRFERPGLAQMGLDRNNPAANWDNGDMSAAVFDFDNDGWPDIYIGASDYPGNHGLLFHQSAPASFVTVPVSDGIDHNRSHGVVAADFDRDGDLDVMVGHSRSRCDASGPNNCYETAQVRLFENVLGEQSNWVQLELVGAAGTNRSAIGARVSVVAAGVTQTQEVGGGYGHYGAQQDQVLHFGLGTACEAQVTVRWPNADATTQTFDVVSGYRFRVEQGADPDVVEK